MIFTFENQGRISRLQIKLHCESAGRIDFDLLSVNRKLTIFAGISADIIDAVRSINFGGGGINKMNMWFLRLAISSKCQAYKCCKYCFHQAIHLWDGKIAILFFKTTPFPFFPFSLSGFFVKKVFYSIIYLGKLHIMFANPLLNLL